MEKNFDLDLNRWGPYNKEYLGVCHIANEALGSTFQVELFPGFFRRRVLASHSSSDDGLKMWGANPQLTRFSYRYELEWKDQVYCDADFVITDDKRCDITCTFVNRTELPQSVNMNLCASLQYPIVKNGRIPDHYRVPFAAKIPSGCEMVDALDYEEIRCAETLASDGRYLGEAFFDGATGRATALNGRCFYKKEHFVRYRAPIDSARVLVRYCAPEACAIAVRVGTRTVELSLPACSEFSAVVAEIPCEKWEHVELSPMGQSVTLDCLVFGDCAAQAEFFPLPVSVEAERTVVGNRMTLRYPYVESTYTVAWSEPAQMVRRYYYTDIGKALSACIHDHVSEVLREKNPLGMYENVLSEPLFLEAGESRSLHFVIKSEECETPSVPAPLYRVGANSDGEPYVFSQNMMAYNTFLNVVYPIYTRRGYIRHNTPGRNWDCLYTWDSGFIGMGLGVADFERAYGCLHTYLTPVGDKHSPYIFHGSVVPTQIFLYQYLFNKFPAQRERLWALYPMVCQYFDFFARMDEREGQMKSGLLKTWDIFYNSGGWDDYPPQKYMHEMTKAGSREVSVKNTTPVVTTAVTVLIAKILRGISLEMNGGDIEKYDRVIEKYTSPIQAYTWNEETGYFSYMLHDENGMPKAFLRAPDGSDYNMGFDGVYPYVAGITDAHQNARILSNVENGLMTPIGVGVVDTRASYYYPGGYWNGSVWMPHQWILWRALLDHGQGDVAFRIADTALRVWKRETDNSYCCFEHFMSANGRGSGFHQFSGLSTPVLMFFESYYTPGTLTVGFETTVCECDWNEEKTALQARCNCRGVDSVAVVCMQAGKRYDFLVNGARVSARAVTEGAYEIPLPTGDVQITVCAVAP